MIPRSWTLALVAALLTTGSAPPPGVAVPDHTPFDELLRRHVSDGGVDYAAWAAGADDRRQLREYLDALAAVRVSALEAAPDGRDVALAYWLNLYNALTLDLVLDRYPVDSIKDLGGLFSSPWKRDLVTVEGQELTLNEIENDVVRPRFDEPRIHFALNCAARSCPPLRAEAYVAARLDEQLEQQTVAFLENADFNSVDDEGRLHLSMIFDWYAGDFEEAAGSVAAYVQPYLPGFPDRPPDRVDVRFRDYDWSLNEATDDDGS